MLNAKPSAKYTISSSVLAAEVPMATACAEWSIFGAWPTFGLHHSRYEAVKLASYAASVEPALLGKPEASPLASLVTSSSSSSGRANRNP
jgi:hypothetical protein